MLCLPLDAKVFELSSEKVSESEEPGVKEEYQGCFDKLQELVLEGRNAKSTILVKVHTSLFIPPHVRCKNG